ncbi:hypothetical protein [Streptomyces beigongshangae]|uniref:hypothetical protein n=1 Tax=Streptomyces beigongshangae TaxID=2841597 RepID=UPI003D323349
MHPSHHLRRYRPHGFHGSRRRGPRSPRSRSRRRRSPPPPRCRRGRGRSRSTRRRPGTPENDHLHGGRGDDTLSGGAGVNKVHQD